MLTNGTDPTAAERRDLEVTGHFDAIFNSAEIGLAKPDPRALQYVCDSLGIEAAAVFFADDSATSSPEQTRSG